MNIIQFISHNYRLYKINKLCKVYNIKNYTINSDCSIDVYGNVDLQNCNITEFLVQFNIISGSFDCSYNNLTTLKGCPRHVGGSFYCNSNNLNSFDHCPEFVGGDFLGYQNNISQLVKLPSCIKLGLLTNSGLSLSHTVENFSILLNCKIDDNDLFLDKDFKNSYINWRRIYQRTKLIETILE